MVEGEPAADYIRHAGAEPAAIATAAEERLLEQATARAKTTPALTPSAQRALLDAYQVARPFGSTYIDPEHVFFALVVNQEAPAGQVLAAAGVTPESLQPGPREQSARRGATPAGAEPGGPQAVAAGSDTPTLDTYGSDLTARAHEGGLDPVIGRGDEIEQTIQILARRTKNCSAGSCRWVLDLEGLARGRRTPSAIDQQTGRHGGQQRGFKLGIY